LIADTTKIATGGLIATSAIQHLSPAGTFFSTLINTLIGFGASTLSHLVMNFIAKKTNGNQNQNAQNSQKQ
jgi:hypothetical protein